jgi:hypothetical protein
MIMSIFRQGRPTTQLDHIAALKLATTEEDLDLITFAFLHEEAVLTALEQEACIVKPLESGDEGMSFASLYDVAITLRDFNRMKAHSVQSPEAIGPSLYETVLICEVEFNPRVMVRLKSLDEKSAKAAIQVLIDTTDFREQLVREMVLQICNSDDVRWVTAGYLRVEDPAPAQDPDWVIVPSER